MQALAGPPLILQARVHAHASWRPGCNWHTAALGRLPFGPPHVRPVPATHRVCTAGPPQHCSCQSAGVASVRSREELKLFVDRCTLKMLPIGSKMRTREVSCATPTTRDARREAATCTAQSPAPWVDMGGYVRWRSCRVRAPATAHQAVSSILQGRRARLSHPARFKDVQLVR